jgi:phospholipase/lecithinase/hemolysin
MLVGGGRYGGIHGIHLGPGVHMRYAATDKKRQNIPWVEYRNANKGVTRTYLASDAKPDSVRSLPVFEMQCVDCHNRSAHAFELPDRAVDDALGNGQLPSALPFIKKTGVDLIKADYKTEEEAEQQIPASLASFYRQKYPDAYGKRADEIQAAGQALLAIYKRNVSRPQSDLGNLPEQPGPH